jgi:hypothetical protein
MNLSYFQTNNESGETVTKQKPEFKSLADIQRVIALGKPKTVIDKFIDLALASEQWQWFGEYNEYLANLAQVIAFNANLPVISTNEKGDDVLAEPKALPAEPIRPVLLTIEEFKAAKKVFFDSYNKKQGVKINGYQVSLNKDNSDGLVSIKAGYELAGDVIFPTNFIADNASGTVSIKLNSFDEFTSFALQFLAARNALFN